MEQPAQQREKSASRRCLFLAVYEFAISLNLVWAAGYGMLTYALTRAGLANGRPTSGDANYYFLRAAARINEFLHITFANAVTTDAVARQTQSRWGQMGQEFAVILSVLAGAFVFSLLIRLCSKTPLRRLILGPLAGLSVLFALPISYLCISRLASDADAVSTTSWLSPKSLLMLLAAEFLFFVLLALANKIRPLNGWIIVIFLALHYGIWVVPLMAPMPNPFYVLVAPRILLVTFPLSWVAWLIWLKRSSSETSTTLGREMPGIWSTAGAAGSLIVLLFIWGPGLTHSFTRSPDFGSMTVQLSRGPCYGTCPAYSIVIHGDGLVEYFGRSNVAVSGRQTAQLQPGEVKQVLRELDSTGFSALEGRAFTWCFDTPSVSLSLSANGRTKTVISDMDCAGSATQARFVRAADTIDRIVGSDRWVKCKGNWIWSRSTGRYVCE